MNGTHSWHPHNYDDIAFSEAVVFAIPMRARFRGTSVREGMLLPGPAGWGEFCPFDDYSDADSVAWLRAAVEQCTAGWPPPVRERVPVSCIVPAVGPDRAAEIVLKSGCWTVKVKVADHRQSADEDLARVAAVRDALGHGGRIRVDANGAWDVDAAIRNLRRLDRAAGGLEYAEQPCHSVAELAEVRRRLDVPIAADESIRRGGDPARVAIAGAADIAVLKSAPLGGVHGALAVAEAAGLPCVVSSAVETSVGLAAEVALAAALPELDFACGLDTGRLLSGDVVPETARIRPAGGFLTVGRGRPEPDAVLGRRYAQTDPDRESWWRRRLTRVRHLFEEGGAR